MIRLLMFLDYLVGAYEWIVIAAVLIGLLIQFGILNGRMPLVQSIHAGLDAVTEPVLKRIRRVLPRTNGIDFSPFVLILFCAFLRWVVIGNAIDAIR